MDNASNHRSEGTTSAIDGSVRSNSDAAGAPNGPPAGATPRPGHLWHGRSRPVLFPNAYVWFVFLSSLDVMLTWAILKRDGTEVNPIAAYVIELWGLNGAIAFKFSLMIFVIIVCEIVGQKRPSAGKRLIRLCVLVSALPVTWSLFLLLMHTYGLQPEV